MWLNSNEELLMAPFIKFIKEYENNSFKFAYDDGSEFIVSLYLYEYESDNGLEESDKGYEEYWEMAFNIISVIKDDSNKHLCGDVLLVNYHTIPKTYQNI